jgi:hypothetical protein
MAIGAPVVYGNQEGLLDCGEVTEGGLRRGGGRASMHLEVRLKDGEGRERRGNGRSARPFATQRRGKGSTGGRGRL